VSSNLGSGRPDRRSEAREQALGLLYEASTKDIDPRVVADAQIVAVDSDVLSLVVGVSERGPEIDALIERFATGWTIQRMPAIDVLVLRLAIYELLARPDVPTAVVLDEAVELAKTFSTDDSGRFVNGVLAAIAKDPQVRGQ
jgi:transcription antitermination protein NusB